MSLLKSLKNLGLASLGLIFVSDALAGSRASRPEFSMLLPYVEGKRHEFENNTALEFGSDVGLGFAYAENYNENIGLRISLDWHSIGYTATRRQIDETRTVWAENFDMISLMFGGTYYLLANDITPFVEGEFGWTFMDTNIPTGEEVEGCIYDPFLGYVCANNPQTYTETEFTYNVGIGLRADFRDKFFVRAGYYSKVVMIDRADSDPDFSGFRFDFGTMY